jgi:hypothetical protein
VSSYFRTRQFKLTDEKKENIRTEKTRSESEFHENEVKMVALAGQFSNQFVDDLKRLAILAI